MAATFSVDITKTAYGHLKAIKRYDRNRILDSIKEQLVRKPGASTRHKKLLRANPLSDWELRVGQFRVFYEIDQSSRHVRVLAIGVKRHSRLFVGGKEVQL